MSSTQTITVDQKWISMKDKLPPLREVVETKVVKDGKEYNVQDMKRDGVAGRLWFFPDSSMYVYYEPTHWRPKQPTPTHSLTT